METLLQNVKFDFLFQFSLLYLKAYLMAKAQLTVTKILVCKLVSVVAMTMANVAFTGERVRYCNHQPIVFFFLIFSLYNNVDTFIPSNDTKFNSKSYK